MKALEILNQHGGFASDEIFEREVMLGDGTTHKLYFKEITDLEYRRYLKSEKSPDPEIQLQGISQLIASCLVNEDGSVGITKEQAYLLKPRVSLPIYAAILDVARVGKKDQAEAGNVSPIEAKTGSGTSSPSASAEEPSKNGSEESPEASSSNGASSTDSSPSMTSTDSTSQQPGSLEA